MRELNFYKYAAILLLVINIGMLVFFFTLKPPHHRPHLHGQGTVNHGEKHLERAAEMLNLDEAQKVEFIALATAHHQQMITINKEQKRLLDNGFNELMDTAPIGSFLQDLKQLEALEGKKITETFKHFKETKELLRIEQIPDFEEFVEGAKVYLLGGGKRRKR